jgi:pterin-4a-carbinolamine dehydratase
VIIINWKNVYNKVTIDPHDADGIMDFQLAKGIDQIVKLRKPLIYSVL